jgi:hypothetical protein
MVVNGVGDMLGVEVVLTGGRARTANHVLVGLVVEDAGAAGTIGCGSFHDLELNFFWTGDKNSSGNAI